MTSGESGRLVKQPGGFSAFVPASLPPAIDFDSELIRLNSDADLSLGRLNGLASIISEPDLFVYLYVRKEALLSSQIEGTQCSLEDVLVETEAETARKLDIREVSNYVAALNAGIERVTTLPISNRLIRELHQMILEGTRGASRRPGEFRTTQNWIGRPGANINEADFVPPPPNELKNCLSDLEKYIHTDDALPVLIRAGIIHAQFETIHPFLDGNGRLGRLLISLLLCHWKVIDKPLVYLSYFFKANRTEYYARLMGVRQKNDWSSWLKFFLRGVAETATMANSAAIEIHKLITADREAIQKAKVGHTALELFTVLAKNPTAGVPTFCELINRPTPTVQRAIDRLVELKILKEVSGQLRNRRFAYTKYLEILRRDTTTTIG